MLLTAFYVHNIATFFFFFFFFVLFFGVVSKLLLFQWISDFISKVVTHMATWLRLSIDFRLRLSIDINKSTKYEYARAQKILSNWNHVVCKYSVKFSLNHNNKDLMLYKGRNLKPSCAYVVKVSESQVVRV